MKFGELVESWERIEKMASRNQMTEELALVLGRVKGREMGRVVYLSLGRLRPAWEDVEFALAEKQVIRVLALFFEVESEVVLGAYKKNGDLGSVAMEMSRDKATGEMNVEEVYECLMTICAVSGTGSVERKQSLLRELFDKLGALERKYVIRVVLGKLRLGFSDQTVIDALSYLVAGDKSRSKTIERAYQTAADIGMIAERLSVEGEGYLREARVTVGVPVIPMLCQRLKSPREMVEKMGKVAVEAKFDGTRVQIHFDGVKVRTFTRNLEETSQMFPELSRMSEWLRAKSIVLDAEAVGIEKESGKILPFQMTITRKRKHGVDEALSQIPLRFYVFDVLAIDGVTVMDLPYKERRARLSEVLGKNEILVADDYRETSDPGEIERWHREYLDQGLEGVIVKKSDSPYIPGRTGWHWVKMKETESSKAKLADTVDGVVMGFYAGRGKRSQFGMGAMLIGVPSGDKIVTLAKIGTGMSDELFAELYKRLSSLAMGRKPDEYWVEKNLVPDVWVEPKMVVEVAADEITKSPIHTAGVALRFPRLVRVREDKGVTQATSLEEVKQIRQG